MAEFDEEDYMSEKFLKAAAETSSSSTKSYAERRKQQLRDQQQRAYIKPRTVLEKEARERGLEKEIGEENKGMKMLMKMGFSKGMTLGQTSKEQGLKAPITVELKSGRKGIGLETVEKRKAEEELEAAMAKRHEANQDFRDTMISRFNEGRIKRRIKAAAKMCQTLDEKEVGLFTAFGGSYGARSWIEKDNWCYNSSAFLAYVFARLTTCTMAVSQSPQGIQSNVLWILATDEDDEEENPIEDTPEESGPLPALDPGLSSVVVDVKEDKDEKVVSPSVSSSSDFGGRKGTMAERKELGLMKLEDKLDRLVAYLRAKHFYCFWCGAQYTDEEDLGGACPGLMEEDHD
ncbi:hypothetical protein BC936DRAFT_145866 [Jimgerdemannia flammicorona]|uniref:G-patch domain-containing protein n=1 Tax=Jimgerdemannia flammicorona TaxID=994334 RepID=A0A433D915_9FUNG|nr:hypothetical protein BC936DRAFT_145866 [Jimgerdemannia flammicorona]